MFQEASLIFTLINGGKIKIDNGALLRMYNYIQRDREDFEAGGVLLGRFIKETKDIVIDNVSVPMIGDKRTRFSFLRSKGMHQAVVDRAWLKSKGTCNYVGEWHTHPEDYPTPSVVDLNNWKNRLREDIFSSRFLYFIIVGRIETRIWEGDKRTLKLVRLKK